MQIQWSQKNVNVFPGAELVFAILLDVLIYGIGLQTLVLLGRWAHVSWAIVPCASWAIDPCTLGL